MPSAFIIKPEVPYHMRSMKSLDKQNPMTSASCETLDYGEILSPFDFERLLAGLTDYSGWLCPKCVEDYNKVIDKIVEQIKKYKEQE